MKSSKYALHMHFLCECEDILGQIRAKDNLRRNNTIQTKTANDNQYLELRDD